MFKKKLIPFLICLLFFIAYAVLSVVRHMHYGSYGFDLGINDQIVWRYAHLQAPLTTIGPFPDKLKLAEHVELVYAFISPFYWVWESAKMLLLLQAAFFCASGIFVYLLARKKKLSRLVSNSLLIIYLGFYGTQNTLWADAHSASFAAAFLMGFVYFFEAKKVFPTMIFFFLAITAKENIGLLTFLVTFVYFVRERKKALLLFMMVSVLYVSFIFFIFFPHVMHVHYLYQNSEGLFSNLNPLSFFDTDEKRQVIWYSLLSYGFLPLLSPLYLIPFIGDLSTYFVVANQLPGAQGLFGQYRISLAPLLIWSTIITLSRYKWLRNRYISVYLIICTLFVQYALHLPLSYLVKSWFWHEPVSVKNINEVITYLPKDASVVSQNNITPHISQRDKIYTLYPVKKSFIKDSPCGQPTCDWFRWAGKPEYMIVDTGPDWDIRHFLANREEYITGIKNLEKGGVIKKYKQKETATLYKIVKQP